MEKPFSPSNSACMSDDIRALTASMIKAKKAFKKTGLHGENAHQKYKYAKLADIYNAVEEALGMYGITIFHYAYIDQGVELLATRLVHDQTNQWIQDVRILQSEKPGNQAKGSANTYMKKYAVLSLCAIAAEDDDGEDEQKYIEQPTLSQEEMSYLVQEIKSAEKPNELYNGVLKEFKVKDLSQIKQDTFRSVALYIAKQKTK